MKTTVKFKNRKQSEIFLTAWSMAISKGHTMRIKDFTSGETEITVYNVSKSGRKFLNNYEIKLNN